MAGPWEEYQNVDTEEDGPWNEYAAAETPAEEKSSFSWGDVGRGAKKVLHSAQTFASGFNEGVSNIAGLPVDAINAALIPVGLNSEEPVGGSSWIKNKIMPEKVKPEGYVENTLNALGEQTAGVMPGVGMAGKVGPVGVALRDAIKVVLGSGLASGAARTVAPDNPWIDLGAQVVGGLTPYSGKAVNKIIAKTTDPDLERRILQRVNKFSTTLSDAERSRRLDTQLNNSIVTSKKGLTSNKTEISNINNEIQDKITSMSKEGITLNREKVLDPVKDWAKSELANHPFPEKAAKDINKVVGEFVRNNPEYFSIRRGQTGKQIINKELDDFYRVANASPDKSAVMAQKWVNKSKSKIADGLRKEITKEWPEIAALNKNEAARIQLNKSLERSVNRIGNREVLSLKFFAALIHNPKTALAEYVLHNPNIQSRLAIAIRKARIKGNGLPPGPDPSLDPKNWSYLPEYKEPPNISHRVAPQRQGPKADTRAYGRPLLKPRDYTGKGSPPPPKMPEQPTNAEIIAEPGMGKVISKKGDVGRLTKRDKPPGNTILTKVSHNAGDIPSRPLPTPEEISARNMERVNVESKQNQERLNLVSSFLKNNNKGLRNTIFELKNK